MKADAYDLIGRVVEILPRPAARDNDFATPAPAVPPRKNSIESLPALLSASSAELYSQSEEATWSMKHKMPHLQS